MGDAGKALAHVPASETPFYALADATRALVLASSQKESESRDLLDSISGVEGPTAAMAGLAWDQLGITDEALPLLDPTIAKIGFNYGFVHVAAAKRYVEIMRGRGDHETADQIVYRISASGIDANPAFEGMYYGEEPSLSALEGEYRFDVQALSDRDRMVNRGIGQETDLKLSLTVLPSGAVIGLAEGDERTGVLNGSVDMFGNLRGRLIMGNREYVVRAKLPPRELFVTCEELKLSGMVIRLLEENGISWTWFAKLSTERRMHA
ncbi:MAG: hypothetical protein IH851_03510 [Armatimonadetes bacterium]|nr:hypothetical protein [Armatimonadota bacterium]